MDSSERPRARDAGVRVGSMEAGPANAITDVEGVTVGHTTMIRGDRVRTGVTAVVPRPGNIVEHPVPGAVRWANAFGKIVGATQVEELGEIETPVLLTSTLNVWRVADALTDYLIGLPGNESLETVNPLVAETNDRLLNDVRIRPVGRDEVFAALRAARGGLPEEGSVGAGTGTVAFGLKGGIGTASRRVGPGRGGFTVGVLVQTNYGGRLMICGAPVGEELGIPLHPTHSALSGGSVVVVVATDAPLDARNLGRLANRTMMGIARTGSDGSNRSGDYAIAFSTAVRGSPLGNDEMGPLFLAAIEATEEAVYNSLFRATTVTARGRTVEALPLAPTLEILRRHRRLTP